MGIGLLLEGFAPDAAADPLAEHPFAVGDHVRVSVKGSSSIVGRVVRAHPAGVPATHAVIAPEGGGAHVLARVGDVKLNTPAQHAAVKRRRDAAEARERAQGLRSEPGRPGVPKLPASGSTLEGLLEAFNPSEPRGRGGKWIAKVGATVHVASELRYIGKGEITHREPDTGNFHVKLEDGRTGRAAPDQVFRTRKEALANARTPQSAGWADVAKLNAVGRPGSKTHRAMLREAFAPAAPAETPQQSLAIGQRQVKAAQGEIASGAFNPSKHPRAAGGRFGYTTGGKRAKSASGRTLGTGSSGALVKSIQRQLGVASDGLYGPNTRAAVVRFQQQHGLLVDGIVGRQTLAALRGNAHGVTPGPIGSKQARVKSARRAPASRAPVRLGGGMLV